MVGEEHRQQPLLRRRAWRHGRGAPEAVAAVTDIDATDVYRAIRAAGREGLTTEELAEIFEGSFEVVSQVCGQLVLDNHVDRRENRTWLVWVARRAEGEFSGKTEPFM